MFAKLANPTFLQDIKPLLTPDEADRLSDEAMNKAIVSVFDALIIRLSGGPWKRMDEMNERFGIERRSH